MALLYCVFTVPLSKEGSKLISDDMSTDSKQQTWVLLVKNNLGEYVFSWFDTDFSSKTSTFGYIMHF